MHQNAKSGGLPLLAAERKYRIVEYVKRLRVVSIAEPTQEFNAHAATIRRDLAEIGQQGLVKRTHGGAAPAIHPQYGLMHPEARPVRTKQSMIGAAEKIIVAADDRKIGKVSLHTAAPDSAIHTLITGTEAREYDIQ